MWESLIKLYRRFQEQINYILFGGLTTAVSIGSFGYCTMAMRMNPLLANVVSWILAVLTAYITNRIWVFHSTNHGFVACLKEIVEFCAGRLLTLGMEEFMIYLFITRMGLNSLVVKLAVQVIVVVVNYILSKMVIFR